MPNGRVLPSAGGDGGTFVAAGGERAVAEAVFGVKPEYLEASFDEMWKRYGTMEGYFPEGLGIEFMRPMTEAVYQVPPKQVIGSSIQHRDKIRDQRWQTGTDASAEGPFHRR